MPSRARYPATCMAQIQADLLQELRILPNRITKTRVQSTHGKKMVGHQNPQSLSEIVFNVHNTLTITHTHIYVCVCVSLHIYV